MRKEKKVDLGTIDLNKDIDTVDLNTIKNKNVREVGAEWLSFQSVHELCIERQIVNHCAKSLTTFVYRDLHL
ncbi:MAG: hypothetical protein PHS59_12815 [Paludibacter sp.]|nr:hypothetical protein [Paludibacter sp.]